MVDVGDDGDVAQVVALEQGGLRHGSGRVAGPSRPRRTAVRYVSPVTDEARLEQVSSGLAPVSDGWFVLNVADAAWLTSDAFGARCVFESDARVLRDNPELEAAQFADLGFRLCVVQPGEPTTMYHRESNQEVSSCSPASACCSSRVRSGPCARGTSCIARPAPSMSSVPEPVRACSS